MRIPSAERVDSEFAYIAGTILFRSGAENPGPSRPPTDVIYRYVLRPVDSRNPRGSLGGGPQCGRHANKDGASAVVRADCSRVSRYVRPTVLMLGHESAVLEGDHQLSIAG